MEIRKYMSCKSYNKEKTEIKKSIEKATDRLINKIVMYQNQGVDFERIFNDDSVKYDKHGNCYTYKAHDRDNTQLRILYACKTDREKIELAIVDYHIKRNSAKKEYITDFGWAADLTYNQIFHNAIPM